jgi:hypothetical protein
VTPGSSSGQNGAVAMLAVPTTVRHTEVDGLLVILDLRTETYKVLDEIASALWSVLIGRLDAGRAFEELSKTYDIDERRFHADLQSFSDTCVAESLLVPVDDGLPLAEAPSRVAAPRGRSGMIGALACLIRTRYALAREGFRATYDRYAALPAGTGSASLAAAVAAFVRAESMFVARRAPDDCLFRSLATYRFLRSLGLPAEHVIGVRRLPFQAHAWVECDGVPVLDDRAPPFKPIARIGGRVAGAGAR